MNKKKLIKVVIPIVSIAWCVGLFFMTWQTILYTSIGIALGLIIKKLKENV